MIMVFILSFTIAIASLYAISYHNLAGYNGTRFIMLVPKHAKYLLDLQ